MLSKILTASTLAGSFGSRTNSAQSLSRVLELDTLFSSFGYRLLQALTNLISGSISALRVPLSSVRRFSELSEIINLSISCQLVFYFFEVFLSLKELCKTTQSAQHKNLKTS